MKVAVTAQAPGLEAQVDSRFGRCAYFVLVDDQTGEWQTLENDTGNAASGAGIQAAQRVANSGAEVVITGDAGPNAYQALTAGKIQLFTGASGTVREAMNAWRSGALTPARAATVQAHAGVVKAPARGASSVVAVATDGDQVAVHFGRCQLYTLAEVNEGAVKQQEVLTNPGHTPGFLPNYLAEHGVQCIIAGGMGPRAIGLFNEKGIDVMIGVQGSVAEVLRSYAEGTLTSDPSVSLCTRGSGPAPCH